jgi:tetratricopeptide (TPR) repeat protein
MTEQLHQGVCHAEQSCVRICNLLYMICTLDTRPATPVQGLTTVATFIPVLDQILDGFRIAVPPHSFKIRPDDMLTRLRVFCDDRFAEFNQNRRPRPLENTITAFRATLYLCPPHSTHRIYLTGRLGDALTRTRVHAASFPDNVAEGMRLLREAMEASSVDGPFYSYCVDRLAWAHASCWERFGVEHDILERVRLCEENLARQPVGSEERLNPLENLIMALEQRAMLRSENTQVLDQAIDVCEQAIDEVADEVTQKPRFYKHLFVLLDRRHKINGVNEDQDRAIDALRSCCMLSSDPDDLSWLASALLVRFVRNFAQSDIEESIQVFRQVVDGLTPDHPNRWEETSNLAGAYSLRFVFSGHVDDIDEGVSLARKALALTPAGHPSRAKQLLDTVLYMRMQGELLKDPDIDSLEERILLVKEAVSLCPPNDVQRGKSLRFLADELKYRYIRLHRSEDLEAVISLLGEAISQPLSDDESIQASCKLADALLSRHRIQKHFEDLEKAITLSRVAIEPENFANSDHAVQSHVRALFERFASSRLLQDIEEAIRIQTKYTYGLNMQNWERVGALVLLSRLYIARGRLMPARGEQGADDLATAVALLKRAIEYESSFPRSLLVDICEGLADFTQLEHVQADVRQSLLAIYRTVLQLLPHVASLNLSVRSRLSVLLDARNLAAHAALCALSIGEVAAALQLLEDGRGTFWTQGLQLRTQLDDVPPELRDRLDQLSDELEQASLSSVVAKNLDPGVLETSRQLQAVRRRRTAAEFEAAVAHVRTIPGLERFMLPTPAGLLARVATRGAVVALIAGQEGCHAIIIPPGGEVQHVRLPTINTERLIKIAEHLRYDQIGARTARAARRARPKSSFGYHQLLSMWHGIVLPIIKALGAHVS